MRDDHIGARVATERKLRGLTQRQLASLAHISVSLLRKVEQGSKPPSGAFVLAASRALRVEREKLTGEPYYSGEQRLDVVHDAMGDLRREALAYRLPSADDVPPRDIIELRSAVAEATQALRRAEVIKMSNLLPVLLCDLRHPALGAGEEVMALRAAAYDLARQHAKGLGHSDLGSLLAERYEWAAVRSGDPLAIALAEVFSGRELDSAGDWTGAQVFMGRAHECLEPLLAHASEPTWSVYGFTHLMTALAAAHGGDADETWSHYDEAVTAASQIGHERDDYRTAFGPTNTGFWGVSLAAQLMNGPEAVARAGRVRPTSAVPRDRRGSFYLDTARGHYYNGDNHAALDSLLRARKVAPQLVRHSINARETVYALAKAERRSTDGLRGLAAWMGLGD